MRAGSRCDRRRPGRGRRSGCTCGRGHRRLRRLRARLRSSLLLLPARQRPARLRVQGLRPMPRRHRRDGAPAAGRRDGGQHHLVVSRHRVRHRPRGGRTPQRLRRADAHRPGGFPGPDDPDRSHSGGSESPTGLRGGRGHSTLGRERTGRPLLPPLLLGPGERPVHDPRWTSRHAFRIADEGRRRRQQLQLVLPNRDVQRGRGGPGLGDRHPRRTGRERDPEGDGRAAGQSRARVPHELLVERAEGLQRVLPPRDPEAFPASMRRRGRRRHDGRPHDAAQARAPVDGRQTCLEELVGERDVDRRDLRSAAPASDAGPVRPDRAHAARRLRPRARSR